jgi:hypothetical protein
MKSSNDQQIKMLTSVGAFFLVILLSGLHYLYSSPVFASGLTFHYSPYDVGPYVEGTYTVFVPWTAFRQYLSPQGATLFGGERPKSDEEKW